MLWIGFAAVGVLGLIILRTALEIRGYDQEEAIQAQCTPTRKAVYTSRPSRRLRWFGLERSIKDREKINHEQRIY